VSKENTVIVQSFPLSHAEYPQKRSGSQSACLNAGDNKDGSQSDSAELHLSRKGYLLLVMRHIVSAARLNDAERKKLLATELLYGVGGSGVYGMCLYDKWFRDGVQDVIQVSALFGESLLEKWCTIAHELGHVLAGPGTGHGPEWKAAARRLQLINPRATGAAQLDDLDPVLVEVLQSIPLPTDGAPICDEVASVRNTIRKGCSVGVGTRGGKSRGAGFGSRLRLWLCECLRPYRVRVASNDFHARCLRCGVVFRRDGSANETGNELILTNSSSQPD